MTDIAAIEAAGLIKTFGQLRAVDGIDLEVRQGEIFGVLGPNGAGKTTMLRMLATLLPIDDGRARCSAWTSPASRTGSAGCRGSPVSTRRWTRI